MQAGINAASSGWDVWVAQGTYVERITHKSGAGLYGGFAGTETVREQRNWAGNKSIIDGNQQGTVVTIPSGATASTIVDGFTIQNGSAGGIRCSSASATIVNNILTLNRAGGAGGGLYAWGASVTLVGNVFVRNSAAQGAALYYYNSASGTIANNTIVGNSATTDGGGMYVYYSSPTISNNIVAWNARGGISNHSGSPTFQTNDVYGNCGYNYDWAPAPSGDLQVDPLIPNIQWGDWHIAGNSPCKDQGVSVPGLPDRDIDCECRPYDGTPVDIGADEWNGTAPAPVTPIVVYVKPSSQGGSDTNDGRSWAAAVATVQKGIDLAYSAGLGGGEIWVAAGTYGKASSKSFVKAYGGFSVGDTFNDRNWNTKQTTLDGGASGSTVSICSAVWCQVDGFTIRNGTGTGGYTFGGGVYCLNADGTIANNSITGNTAWYGAGISCSWSSPQIRQNTIESNTVPSVNGEGGGMFCYNGSSPMVSENRFVSNDGKDHGGAIALEDNDTRPVITNNLFLGNHVAGTGGGAINALVAVPWIINNTFVGNWAGPGNGKPGDGGAIILRGTSGVTVYNNIFYGNTAANGQSVFADSGCGAQRLAFCDAWNPTGTNDALTHFRRYNGTVIAEETVGSSIYLDPLFVYVDANPANGDYHLTYQPPNSISPCIDKGANPGSSPYDKLPAADFDRNMRPVDISGVTNYGTDAFCDMGAYELQQ